MRWTEEVRLHQWIAEQEQTRMQTLREMVASPLQHASSYVQQHDVISERGNKDWYIGLPFVKATSSNCLGKAREQLRVNIAQEELKCTLMRFRN